MKKEENIVIDTEGATQEQNNLTDLVQTEALSSDIGGYEETSPLQPYYDKEIKDTFKEAVKKHKNYITEIDYESDFLIYKTPKSLKYLQKDGSFLELSAKYYCYYIEINTKSGKHTFKEMSNHFLVGLNLNTGEADLQLMEYLLKEKVAYDLAQREKKSKGKIKIDIDSINTSLVKYVPAKYEVYFKKHNGDIEKKIVNADINGHKQVKILATYLLKKHSKKYENIERIYQIDFAKTVWAKLFVSTKQRRPLSTKDLKTFTYKFYKIFDARVGISFPQALDELIRTTNGNIRSTGIALKDITQKDPYAGTPYVAMKKLNRDDMARGKRPNFDSVYLAMAELADGRIDTSKVFYQIADVIERRVFLQRSLKSAVKKPLFVILFLFGVMVFAVRSFSPILYEIYEGIGLEKPPLTVFLNGFIEFVFYFFPFVVLGIFITLVLFNYFSKYSLYGRKVMHDIYITTPLLGKFMKNSDYEIFLAVAQQLYAGSKSHESVLPILKKTVNNEHIKGVINTAAYNFNMYKINPGKTFDKFPQYIDPRLGNLLKTDTMETRENGELQQLANTYRIDNNEFIDNLQSIISNSLILIAGIIIFLTMMATIVPMIEIINEF